MKIILLQDVKNLGPKGKEVEASDGYARNFLIPKGFALDATNVASHEIVQKIKSAQKQQEKKKSEQFSIINKLQGKNVKVVREATESGTLYAAVTANDLAKVMKDLHLEVDPSKIKINKPIKSLGLHQAEYNIENTKVCFQVQVDSDNLKSRAQISKIKLNPKYK